MMQQQITHSNLHQPPHHLQGIRMQSKEKYHLMQKYIILGDTDSLIEEMYEWSRDDASPAPPHLLRFMAHLVLLFRMVGVNTKVRHTAVKWSALTLR